MKFFNFMVSSKKIIWVHSSIALLILSSLLIGVWFLYQNTKIVLKNQLFGSLQSLVSSSVELIEVEDVLALTAPEDYTKEEYKRVVEVLSRILKHYPEISFAYVEKIEQTENGEKVIFLADGWSLDPNAHTDTIQTNDIDINRDGKIDSNDELTFITEVYRDAPIESIRQGYEGVYIDKNFYTDEWGRFLTGYAPIKDAQGNTVAVLAIDIRDTTFNTIIKNIFNLFLIVISIIIASTALFLTLFIFISFKKDMFSRILDEEKSLVIGLVGHEMKTPLARIRWLLSAAREEFITGNPKAGIHIQEAYDESVRGSDFSKIILDVSRIQFGKLKLHLEEINVYTMIQKIQKEIDFMSVEKNIIFKNNIPEIVFFADPYYLLLALKNIISNAIKYSHNGGEVIISGKENKDSIEITISDNGIGIPKEEQKKILSGFYRAANTKETTGHGLGMYLAYQIISHHDGQLKMYSEEGKGTLFTVVIPKK